jgi:hypothetical protein
MGMDVMGKGNTDAYFRASCWGWRPIHAICDLAIEKQKLPYNTKSWGYNDGGGLETQEDCNKLADAIETSIAAFGLKQDDDCLYLCLGSWCTPQGEFVTEQVEEELNEAYPQGTILYNSVVTKDGTIAQSSHMTDLESVKKFVSFLRECEGFEIW